MNPLPEYKIIHTDSGFHYQLVGGNGEIMASSENYPTRENAERGVEAAKKASAKAVTLEDVTKGS